MPSVQPLLRAADQPRPAPEEARTRGRTSEPALLDEKEDSYFSEIRNFIANSEMNQASTRMDKRPEIQDLDSNPPCPGSASAKPEDVEEEEEEELEEEDDDSLAGKSQEDTVSPTPEPQGVYEDEEDEEPPSLTMGFDHTRRHMQ